MPFGIGCDPSPSATVPPLIAKVWGGDTYVTARTVDSVVSRLRRKIERDPNDPEMILTAWGVGYKFVDA